MRTYLQRFLVSAVFFFLGVFAMSAKALGQPFPVSVEVAPVVYQPLRRVVTFVATLEPDLETTVGAEVGGRVIRSDVREGDPVIAGKTILIQLDKTSREIALRGAKAAVDKAREKWEELKRGYRPEEITQRRAEVEEQKAILARAEEDFRRAERLYRGEFISRSELDRMKSEYLAVKEKHERALAALALTEAGPRKEEIAQAEAELREAKARRDQHAYELDRTTLRSPIGGYLVKKHVEVGTWVSPGAAVADLVDLDPMYATGPVGERKIDLLRKGMSATVTVDALPGLTFPGTISFIVPQADPQSRTFPVKVSIPNPDGRLKGGMLARVTVQVERKGQGFFVPKDALVLRGADHVMFVVDGEKAREYRVRIGEPYEGMVEVHHPDLKPGQEVVVLGNKLLADGMKVQKRDSQRSDLPPGPK